MNFGDGAECRCICLPNDLDTVVLEIAELVIITILGGSYGKCEEAACGWWGDVPSKAIEDGAP